MNSAFTAQEQRRLGWRHRPTSVTPYGVDLSIENGERAALRAIVDTRHGLDPKSQTLGILARFDPWKGIDIALRAAAPLLRDRPELRFIVVGGQYRHFHPSYGSELHALVDREGISRQVIFAGFQMDVRPYLARMTLLVHASRQPEPFGLTIVEAMATGVPVVVARGGGAAEIVEPGVDGLLYESGNVKELGSILAKLLDDEALRTSLATAGLRKTAERYRPRHMMRAIEQAYDEVLG